MTPTFVRKNFLQGNSRRGEDSSLLGCYAVSIAKKCDVSKDRNAFTFRANQPVTA